MFSPNDQKFNQTLGRESDFDQTKFLERLGNDTEKVVNQHYERATLRVAQTIQNKNARLASINCGELEQNSGPQHPTYIDSATLN